MGNGPEEAASDADDEESAGETPLCFPSHDTRIGGVRDKTTRKDADLYPVGKGGAAKTSILEKSKTLDTCRLELHDSEPVEVLGSITIFQWSLLPSRAKLSVFLHS